MRLEIKIPAMGESITEATIGRLIKQSGSPVTIDEEILELETDKVNQILYSPGRGVLTLTVTPEQVVKIGDVIGFVDTDATAKVPQVAKAAEPEQPKPKAAKAAKAAVSEQRPAGAIRYGKEDFLKGLTGGQEEVAVETTLAMAPAKAVPAPDRDGLATPRESRRKMTKIRQVIAERLVAAQQNSAMLTTFNEVDMSAIVTLRGTYKDAFEQKHGARLGFMSFFVKAAVSALKAFPGLNSYIDGLDIVERHYYDIGVAVSTERGLLVPVVRDCDQKSFAEIEKDIVMYAKAAKEKTLSVDALQGGGFTITNGGIYGSLLSTPIINPPQVGILGMHAIQERPIAIAGQVVIRPMMYLALSYDHRIVDGKEAVSFLVHMKKLLENPGSFALGL